MARHFHAASNAPRGAARTPVLALLCLLTATIPVPAAIGGYAEVDAYADATPTRAEGSLDGLAAYLSGVGPGDEARARALYRWITTHIEYDTEGYRSGNYGSLTAAAVLERRRSVCSGYAALFEEVGRRMGLEVVVVNGWSKGYSYAVGGSLPDETNHAWNAVRIAGTWRLVDTTWGAGFVHGSPLRFEYRFVEHYFLTPPEQFVVDHLPEDPRWQLLPRPIDRGQYMDLAFVRPAFFACGLAIESHERSTIRTGSSVTVRLGAEPDSLLTAHVLRPDGQLLDRHTLVHRADSGFEIDAVFPGRGDYLLRIWAKRTGDDGNYEWAADYLVRASSGAPQTRFALVYENYGTRGVRLVHPTTSPLTRGAVRFELTAPGAAQIAVIQGSDWNHLERTGDRFTGAVRLSQGTVTVFGRYPDDANWEGLASYEVE